MDGDIQLPSYRDCVIATEEERTPIERFIRWHEPGDDGEWRRNLTAAIQHAYDVGRNHGLEAACGALAATAIAADRPECCDPAAYDRGECCGNPNLLVAAADVGDAIRKLKEPVSGN